MKIRIFTLLAAIFLLSNISWGQVGEYRVSRTKTITKKIEKPKVIREDNPKREGFFVIPEVGFLGVDYDGYTLSLQGIFGYEFNNHLAFGVGTGLNYSNNETYIPLYISLRGDITKKQIAKGITPYYSIDFGYNVSLGSGWREYIQGVLFSPEFGIRTNKFYIGTEFMITNHHYYHYEYYHYDYYYYDNKATLVWSLKLGYKIPFKQH